MTKFDRVRKFVKLVLGTDDVSVDVLNMGNNEFHAHVTHNGEVLHDWLVVAKVKRLTAHTMDKSRVVARLS